MPGLQDLQRAAMPITGPASVDAVVAALSPQEIAMASQGIDPFGSDQGMMQGQSAIAGAMPQGAIPGQAPTQMSGLTPEARMAIGQMLEQSLAAIGQPASEGDAMAMQSIQNALMALQAGGQ